MRNPSTAGPFGASPPRERIGPSLRRAAAALWIPVTATGLAAAFVARIPRSQAHSPVALAAQEPDSPLTERVATARRELRARPGDPRLTLRLEAVLFAQAMGRAQATCPEAPGLDAEGEAADYRRALIVALTRDPATAEARALARSVATGGPTPALRGRAWADLAVIYGHLGHEAARHRCLQAAAREDPQYREPLHACEELQRQDRE